MKRDIHCPFYQFLDFEYTIITIARPQILFTHLEQVLGKTELYFALIIGNGMSIITLI